MQANHRTNFQIKKQDKSNSRHHDRHQHTTRWAYKGADQGQDLWTRASNTNQCSYLEKITSYWQEQLGLDFQATKYTKENHRAIRFAWQMTKRYWETEYKTWGLE